MTHRRELVHTLCKRINENLLGLQLLVDLGLADREQASNALSLLSKAWEMTRGCLQHWLLSAKSACIVDNEDVVFSIQTSRTLLA